MADPFIAEIKLFAGNFAPRDWAFCHGQLLSISSNTALFSLLGTMYGGDGRTSFGLPDLRGRAFVGQGHGPGLTSRVQGQKSGFETASISEAQMASHTHTVTHGSTDLGAQTANGDVIAPSPSVAVATPTIQNNPGLTIFSTSASDTVIEGGAMSGPLDLADTGSGQTHENMMPFIALNYIIALNGTYPSRG